MLIPIYLYATRIQLFIYLIVCSRSTFPSDRPVAYHRFGFPVEVMSLGREARIQCSLNCGITAVSTHRGLRLHTILITLSGMKIKHLWENKFDVMKQSGVKL